MTLESPSLHPSRSIWSSRSYVQSPIGNNRWSVSPYRRILTENEREWRSLSMIEFRTVYLFQVLERWLFSLWRKNERCLWLKCATLPALSRPRIAMVITLEEWNRKSMRRSRIRIVLLVTARCAFARCSTHEEEQPNGKKNKTSVSLTMPFQQEEIGRKDSGLCVTMTRMCFSLRSAAHRHRCVVLPGVELWQNSSIFIYALGKKKMSWRERATSSMMKVWLKWVLVINDSA